MAHHLRGTDGYLRGTSGYRRGSSGYAFNLNGVQYALGQNGVDGFDITAFQGWTAFTFSTIIQTPAVINSSSTGKRMFELANADRTDFNLANLGQVSGAISNEYTGFGRFLSASPGLYYANDGGGVINSHLGFTHILIIMNGNTSGSMFVNGVSKTLLQVNTPAHTASPTQLSLFATPIGGSILDGVAKETFFMNRVLTGPEATALNTFYSDPNVSIVDNALYSDANFVELYTMQVVSGKLKASKSSSHDLTIIG